MSNHPNRGWRARWTVQRDARVAVHTSGVRVRFQPSPTNPVNDQIVIDGADRAPANTDIGRLVQEAVKLWMEE